MGFLAIKSPFHKDSIDDYQGVLVPLAQASRHPTVAAEYARRRSSEGLSDNNTSSSAKSAEDSSIPKEGDAGEDGIMRTSSAGYNPYTLEGLRAEVNEDVAASGHDSSYDLKSKVINKAIQDIGMGRYNWELFILCGFGWFADNLWLQGVALTLPSLSAEFGISETHVRYTTCSLFVGLCLGASFWGIGSDIMGRRLAFNLTLLIAGVFGIAAGAAPNWVGACGLFAALGVGVGGNLPVDGALFLEFLPNASGGLLTLLSVWWPVGQLVASLIGWAFLGSDYPLDQGWRYFVYTMGTLTFVMFLARFLLFHLYESPKFLLSRGRQSEAVAVVHGMAYKNKTTTWLTEEILNEIGGDPLAKDVLKLSTTEIIKRKFASFSTERIGPLFHTKKLGWTTALLWFCWLTIGMGYPLFNAFLPQYLSNGKGSNGEAVSNYTTYRNYAISSVVGVPGSIIACYTVDIKYIGRKGTMAIATMLSGVFLFLFTLSADSNYQVAFSSIEAFFQNIMYGVLYAYTPEVFPAPNRGTGTGISSFLNRIAGLCAPIIAANIPDANPNAPVFVSGGLILAAFVAMIFLPIETRGNLAESLQTRIKMSVRIVLDDPHAFYTNLDFISGRIILNLTSDENVTAIVVKLEGESRTVLLRPVGSLTMQGPYSHRQQRREGLVQENHKILYRVAQVFPTIGPNQTPMSGLAYTLRAGQHEYPFRIKIPFNNGCSDPQQQQMQMGAFGGFGLSGLQQMQYRHVKRTLPPSLTGFPGEAEIRYYVKVTVQRPSLFKENRRSAIGFKFLPIEPPRPAKTQNEVYARRPYEFQAGLAGYGKKSALFQKKPTKMSETAPKGEIDARLPSPAILTCNEPLPLRIVARKLNESAEHVFLTGLQVNLFGFTEVRALDVARTETNTWVLLSTTGLSIPISSPGDELRKDRAVDPSLWNMIPLPNTVAPSFYTCNLTRKYELEVRPQTITLPLRFQIEVYSGISPPAALLDAIASRPTIPVRPQTQPTPAVSDPLYPPQAPPGGPSADDAPPSYEDAMAEDISPADGPRREYSGVTDVNAPGLDEKGGAAPKYSAIQGNPGPGPGGLGRGGPGRGGVV
ncbi:hypothetical protein EG329_004890 [Mollisiaceae sp. DMI_Dod_QoI]|nr:hypothetical protein EG329_004890 [Helotiales sp. DMI_Dod_QoI]